MNSNARTVFWLLLCVATICSLNSRECLAQGAAKSLPALQLGPAILSAAIPQNTKPQAVAVETKTETSETSTDATAKTVSPEEEAAAADKAKLDERAKLRSDAIAEIAIDRRPSTILALWSGSKDAILSGEAAAHAAMIERPSRIQQDAFDSSFGSEFDNPFGRSNDQVSNIDPIRDLGHSVDEGKGNEAKADGEVDPNSVSESEEHIKFLAALKDISRNVTLGEWKSLKEKLSNRELFSEEEAQKIFDLTVEKLSANLPVDFSHVEGLSQEMRDFLNGMMRDSRNNPGARFAEQNLMHFADLTGLIAAVPTKIEDRQIVEIAKLLKEAIDSGSEFTEFLKAIRDGGPDLMEPRQAALLLSMAGRELETIEFLPSMETAIAEEKGSELNLIASHYMSLYRRDLAEEQRENAWRATLAVLNLKNAKPEQRREALARAVSIAPRLNPELGQAWLQANFSDEANQGKEIVASIGTATASLLAQTPQDASGRLRNLQLQHSAVHALLSSNTSIDAEWKGILNLLATNWLQEAQVTANYSENDRYGPGMRRDRYGNLYYVDPSEESARGQNMQMGQISAVDVADILAVAPSGEWMESIESGMAAQYSMIICRLWLKVKEDAKAFPYIEQLASAHPEIATDLADEFLEVWTDNHNPNTERDRTNYYMFVYGYEEKADRIPLTRSKQQRNLTELADWVGRIRKLPIQKDIDQGLLASAFMTCHSDAEVFDIATIEGVFGQWDSIEPKTMANLVQQMRKNLAGKWRDPNVQRDAKTNRQKKDIDAEVQQGYQVAKAVVDQALTIHSDSWPLMVAYGSIIHDENDYLQSVAPTSAFSENRQQAFDWFKRAAEQYISLIPTLPEREQTNAPFDTWFYAALGATDLAGVSEKNQPIPAEMEKIATLMNSIPGEAGERHQDRFANALFTRMSAVSPSCKFRYLENGFRLVGENPRAEEARKVYDYYHDLVTELELVTRVDGDESVSLTEPFGVFVDLKHTKELERESSGFSKYLQNQNNLYYSYNYGRPTENYRDKFQDAVTVALQEQFEILSITFNHPEATSRPAAPAGWRVTPYAYLLLKPRGPEVDKIPSLHLDLDFLDTSGYVVLPITSSPLPIGVNKKESSDSHIENAKLVEVLDERQAAEGKLIVEIKATGKGLVPALEEIVDSEKRSGFVLQDTEDSGVSVVEFDRESSDIAIVSERTWTLHYAAENATGPAPAQFSFPSPRDESYEVSYQRYVDADLEEVQSDVLLVSRYGTSTRAWLIGLLCGAAALVAIVGLAISLMQGRKTRPVVEEMREAPVTPFSVLARLKVSYAESGLPEDQRNRLRDDIQMIEKHYFAESTDSDSIDLESIAGRWR